MAGNFVNALFRNIFVAMWFFVLVHPAWSLTTTTGTTRRVALQTTLWTTVPLVVPLSSEAATFTSQDGRYSFEYDDGFVPSSKPVKTHLDEVLVKGPGKRQIGVVVDRVKIKSLEDFGSPQFVAEKVVNAERNRDGVLDAALVDARAVNSFYQLEYTNASTRGDNHFLSRVAIEDGRLFVMTAQAPVTDYDDAVSGLRRAIDTFRITSS